MAVRKTLSHDTKTRDRIRTSQLINRLEMFALSEIDENECKVEMSRSQVAAALGLIKKTLPDLQATTFDGNVDVTATVTGLAFKPRARTG